MQLSSLLLLVPMAAQLAHAERRLPAEVQFDLVFPRNETYSPTQWFPVIFGMQNADAILPVGGLTIELGVWTVDYRSNEKIGTWGYGVKNFYSDDISKAPIPTPGVRFFHLPPISMTNGTKQFILT